MASVFWQFRTISGRKRKIEEATIYREVLGGRVVVWSCKRHKYLQLDELYSSSSLWGSHFSARYIPFILFFFKGFVFFPVCACVVFLVLCSSFFLRATFSLSLSLSLSLSFFSMTLPVISNARPRIYEQHHLGVDFPFDIYTRTREGQHLFSSSSSSLLPLLLFGPLSFFFWSFGQTVLLLTGV